MILIVATVFDAKPMITKFIRGYLHQFEDDYVKMGHRNNVQKYRLCTTV